MKNGIRLLVGSLMLLNTSTTMAASLASPDAIEITGSYNIQYRNYSDNVNNHIMPFQINGTLVNGKDLPRNESVTQQEFRLNVTANLDPNTKAFLRLTKLGEAGQITNAITGSANTTINVDQYGVRGSVGDWGYSAGRQGLWFGQGSIIGTGHLSGAISPQFDGIVLTKKTDDFDLKIIGGKTTWDQEKWIGAEVSSYLTQTVKVDLSYANSKGTQYLTTYSGLTGTKNNTNYYAVNAAYMPSKEWIAFAGYTKSSCEKNNTAAVIGSTYFLAKDKFFRVMYIDVGKNSVDMTNSAIGAVEFPYSGNGLISGDKYSGFFYTYNLPINRNITLDVNYMDLKVKGYSGADHEVNIGLTWVF